MRSFGRHSDFAAKSLHGFRVLENFLPDPDRMRASAIESGFGSWRPNKGEVGSSIYDGMSFWGEHGMGIRKLVEFHGVPIYPASMFFRVTLADTEAAYVHSDREAGDYTAIVYLSEHDKKSGTGFYSHKASGITRMPPLRDLSDQLKSEMVEGSNQVWTQTHFVPGAYNRALVFEAPLFHSRLPKHGYGSTVEDGRMVWVCHYSLE